MRPKISGRRVADHPRRITVVTVGRSDFSILRPLCEALNEAPDFDLTLWVGGAHFDPAGGMTIRDIEASGLPIGGCVAMPAYAHDPAGAVASMAAQVAGFGRCAEDALAAGTSPDLVMILGDRFEAIAAGLAMVPYGIPIAHLSGGSITEGAIDDMFRHALTKLAALHFCDLPEFARRIQQLGEETWRIFTVGALGLDGIRRLPIQPFQAMVGHFDLAGLQAGYILATLHPETTAPESAEALVAATIAALDGQPRQVVFTYPNADPGADSIIAAIEAAATRRPDHVYVVRNFGWSWFYTAMAHAGLVVGNSSSGIYEAASFALPVVDIGDRQAGRFHGENVLHAPADLTRLQQAISKAEALGPTLGHANVYGNGHASQYIMTALRRLDRNRVRQSKRFAPVDTRFTGERDDL